MRRLSNVMELLDGQLDGRVLRANLRDMARVNRWLGGAALSWRALERLPVARTGRPLRMLDVGTGSADIPRYLLRRAARRGARLEIVATDVRPEIVEIARELSRGCEGLTIRLERAGAIDARNGAFDVVHSSLLLHHLEPPDAEHLLREMARVARSAVVINDLARGRLWLAGAWLLGRVATRNRYTRHDAPLSVRRAYTYREMVVMAKRAGLHPAAIYHAFPPYRFAAVFVHGAAADG